jgi:hypothetical protein
MPIGCPSLAGVATPARSSTAPVLKIVGRLGRMSLLSDLRDSDRSLWKVVRADWRTARPRRPVRLTKRDVVSLPAARSPYADLVAHNCGVTTLRRSWWVAVCPYDPDRSNPCSLREAPATTTHFLFIRRRGRWLVWFEAP